MLSHEQRHFRRVPRYTRTVLEFGTSGPPAGPASTHVNVTRGQLRGRARNPTTIPRAPLCPQRSPGIQRPTILSGTHESPDVVTRFDFSPGGGTAKRDEASAPALATIEESNRMVGVHRLRARADIAIAFGRSATRGTKRKARSVDVRPDSLIPSRW
jgi:hypothetical protein